MSKRNFALGTLIAAGVGYLAGILTAPKSGRETRKDIQSAAIKAKTEAEKKLKALHSELTDLIDTAQKKANDIKKTAKADYDKTVDMAQTAKDKARRVLSAIHEGDAEDKDLQAAITESKKAVEHLRSFLGKNA